MELLINLVFALLIFKCNGETLQKAPIVTISFPDVGDVDFQNETVAIMSNSNAAFVLECNATYPIEWEFHYSDEDDGTSEKLKLAQTRRISREFTDSSTYRYYAKIRIEYNGKLLVLSNFTCKGSVPEDANKQTHVYMTDENKKKILKLEISNEFRFEEAMIVPEENRNCSEARATVFYDFNPCWACLDGMGKELELDFQTCKTPIQCNSIQRKERKGKQCLEILEEESEDYFCKIEAKIKYSPMLVLCKNYGAALAQFYFFGIYKFDDFKDDDGIMPPIYFSWDEVNPNEMIHIHKIPEKIYLGQEVILVCEYSRFYFSLGSYFGIEGPSGPEFIEGNDIYPCETDADKVGKDTFRNCNDTFDFKRRGTFRAELKYKFNGLGNHEVFCFGPVWNTTEWVNASRSFQVRQGEAPQVIYLGQDENKDDFIVGQTNRSIKCEFYGKPQPEVEWTGPKYSSFMTTTTNDSSTITFTEIGFQTSGKYTCTVFSYLGNNSQSFELNSLPPPVQLTAGEIAGIIIGCLIVVLIISAIMYKMWTIILVQRTALRLLTDAELKQFHEGNPDMAKNTVRNEYFDNPIAIDALPYDSKFEIPEEELSIDYSSILGSGNFGLVLKGKVRPKNVSCYLNLRMSMFANNDLIITEPIGKEFATEEGDGDEEQMEVAVKTCKKDVDVASFKALLTEVKVMGYLGQHANIVSLVGVSTQNIRNREVYIAVEFCNNGSLDVFLRKNKEFFVNKVKHGKFIEENDNQTGTVEEADDGYKNLLEIEEGSKLGMGEPFTNKELFKWAYEIAFGVEYIHSKKVIHGDLAIRNVLLTNGFVAKIGDFGLSRQLEGMSNYIKKTQCPLPWRNMAIESIKEMEFSVKSDIWSLGVTLWELFTLGTVPYPGMPFTLDFISNLEDGSLRLSKPPNATNEIYELMLMCWEVKPVDRPSPTEVKSTCLKLLRQIKSRK